MKINFKHMKKKWIVIISLIILFFLWFITSPCGREEGYGYFDEYKCKCAGTISGDIFEIPSFSSTLNYRCYGIKIGKTRLINTNIKLRLENNLENEIKIIKTKFGSVNIMSFDTRIHKKICFKQPNIIYFDDDKKEHTIESFTLDTEELCLYDENHQFKIRLEGKGDSVLISKP